MDKMAKKTETKQEKPKVEEVKNKPVDATQKDTHKSDKAEEKPKSKVVEKTQSAKLKSLEREYVIPLRARCKKVPKYKRGNKAIKTIKEFLVRHMKIYNRDLKKIKIDKYLNEAVWFRGIKKPPIKIKVRAVKEKDFVRVELAEMHEKLKFKKLREEKREQKAKESVKDKKTLMQKAKEGIKPAEKTAPKGVPSVEGDVNTEGKEKKEEEKEKKSAVVEAGQKRGKDVAKQMKHQAVGKTKQPKRQIRKALEK